MTIRLHKTITRTIVDEPRQFEDGRMVKDRVVHEETTPYDPVNRGTGGTTETHVTVDGPISAEFTQAEATEVVKALVLSRNLNQNDSNHARRIERVLLRMGLDPADLVVFDA
jgi:hypothetical protein